MINFCSKEQKAVSFFCISLQTFNFFSFFSYLLIIFLKKKKGFFFLAFNMSKKMYFDKKFVQKFYYTKKKFFQCCYICINNAQVLFLRNPPYRMQQISVCFSFNNFFYQIFKEVQFNVNRNNKYYTSEIILPFPCDHFNRFEEKKKKVSAYFLHTFCTFNGLVR